MRPILLRLEKLVFRLAELVLFVLMLALVVTVVLQVTFRYFLHRSLYWSVELSRFLFVWLVFLGAAVGVHMNSHVSIDAVVKAVPEGTRRMMRLLTTAVSAAFLLLVTYYGLSLALQTMGSPSEALKIPYGWLYVSVPISSLMMLLACFGRTLEGKAESTHE
ncbi:MAG: TRAP transporter small permease [Bacillota bacterium]